MEISGEEVKENNHHFFFFLFAFAGLPLLISAQTATIYGTIRDTLGKQLPAVNVSVENTSAGTASDANGFFSLNIPSGIEMKVYFSFIGFRTESITVNLTEAEKKEIRIVLKTISSDLPEFTIQDRRRTDYNIQRINPKNISQLPSASGNFEAVLKTLPGVASNNELSSQYSVRGGNFDENLVYVNDVEIYRPFLVRSGQQEGLSFINSDLVSSIQFSAGGFDAKYGDKLSSVLDIKYKKPGEWAGSAGVSLLGATGHVEGVSKNKKIGGLLGIRQKSNQYILGSLETKGEYKPSFTDIQGNLIFEPNPKLEFSLLSNYSRNLYRIIPENRQTDFGTINQALRLRVYFDGQEKDDFRSTMSAFTTTIKPNEDFNLKFITSAFYISERENFDILGQYFLDELERDLGSDEFGNSAYNIGVGSFLNHARNNLEATIYNAEFKGNLITGAHNLLWGVKYQHEKIEDELKEWTYLDSSDYSIPNNIFDPERDLEIFEILTTQIGLRSNRYTGYLQDTWTINDTSSFSVTGGVRAHYWDNNEELVISPRGSIAFRPKTRRYLTFRASAGYYYQPPFYRELRNTRGVIFPEVKAQQSIHFVFANDYQFLAWGREFKLTSEAYYKLLENMIPYKIDNVRVRYLPEYVSKGFARGLDFRINGEFVPGIESWISLSVLETKEDIIGDYFYDYFNAEGELIIPGFSANQVAVDSIRTEPGFIARPTDQRFSFSMFFQDYLPKFPTYKMHLNLVYGTGLPFGPPGTDRYKDVFRLPAYRRVDIGFSKQIIGEEAKTQRVSGLLKPVKSFWIALEVFNLLQVNNTISYLWIKDVTNRQYAVPNYLTARQLNFRMMFRF